MQNKNKDQIVRMIMHNANRNISNLAGHLISSPSQTKEAVLAEINYNRTMAELAQVALS